MEASTVNVKCISQMSSRLFAFPCSRRCRCGGRSYVKAVEISGMPNVRRRMSLSKDRELLLRCVLLLTSVRSSSTVADPCKYVATALALWAPVVKIRWLLRHDEM